MTKNEESNVAYSGVNLVSESDLLDSWTDIGTDGQIEQKTWTEERSNRLEGGMDRTDGGRMDRRTDGLIDGQMDRYKDTD